MMVKDRIVISVFAGSTILAVGLIILFLAYGPSLSSLLILTKYPPIDIIGTIDFIPNKVHGERYVLVPEQAEIRKLEQLDVEQLFRTTGIFLKDDKLNKLLSIGKLNPELEGKKVRIHGAFIEDYEEYKIESLQGRPSSADPWGVVIIVKDVQILENNKSG